MQSENKATHQLNIFAIKVFAATTIVFFGLVRNVRPVDLPINYAELYESFVTDEYIIVPDEIEDKPGVLVDETLQEQVDEILRPTLHGAGEVSNDNEYRTEMLDQTCNENPSYCGKITHKGTRNKKDKYVYTTLSVFYMKLIDSKIVWNDNLDTKLGLLELRQYEGKSRGLASHTRVYMHVPMMDNVVEFVQVLTHELGHVIDLGVLEGKSNVYDLKYTEFDEIAFREDDPSLAYYALSRRSEHTRNPGSKSTNFCSGYAMSDPYEDFAECLNAYLNRQRYFYLLALEDEILYKKYQFFANLFDGDYIFSQKKDRALAEKYNNSLTRPRDTTRM